MTGGHHLLSQETGVNHKAGEQQCLYLYQQWGHLYFSVSPKFIIPQSVGLIHIFCLKETPSCFDT